MRLAKIRPQPPLRHGAVWGEGWNCETCGLKPYRHDTGYPRVRVGTGHGLRARGCARYVNHRARRLLGWT